MLGLIANELIKRCDPNEEDCSDVIDTEFKSYGVSNLGWSSLFKLVVPDLTASLMFWYAYDETKVKDWEYKKIESSNFMASDFFEFLSMNEKKEKEKKGYYGQFKDWWDTNNFTQHNWAWFHVAAAMTFLYNGHFFLWFIWAAWGWAPTWLEFYIEHIISNLNWGTYGYGLWHMVYAVV